MARTRESLGGNETAAQLPDAGVLFEAQIAAAENATRMAGTACHYAISMNRAWLNLWNNRLMQYTELPKRLAGAQIDFMEKAFDQYQDSIHQLGEMTTQATNETEAALEKTVHAASEMARPHLPQPKDSRKAQRPRSTRAQNASGERRGSEGAH
ncbi:MAG: hypothetical protein WBX25_21770 [Rhodomicrobium sp.]